MGRELELRRQTARVHIFAATLNVLNQAIDAEVLICELELAYDNDTFLEAVRLRDLLMLDDGQDYQVGLQRVAIQIGYFREARRHN